jgi:hypothetical protein
MNKNWREKVKKKSFWEDLKNKESHNFSAAVTFGIMTLAIMT